LTPVAVHGEAVAANPDFDFGLPDMHLRIRDDDHLPRAVLNGVAEDDWLTGDGEQRTIPQPVIAKAKKE
jgi:hypothetical protein